MSGTPAAAAIGMLDQLWQKQSQISVTGERGEALSLEEAFSELLRRLREVASTENKLIFIGNGGSAAIASHQAVDFWKDGQIQAIAFNDASLLTCMSNDFGYEEVFAKPIGRFARSGDLLIAVSSSGKSPNILKAVRAAKGIGCGVVTLSGFEPTNPLRASGQLNFHVPTSSYRVVEVLHLALLHALLEARVADQKPPSEAKRTK